MSKEEAAGLVIQSASLSKGGDIFLLDIQGVPKKIIDLAREMIWLSGLKRKDEEKPYWRC